VTPVYGLTCSNFQTVTTGIDEVVLGSFVVDVSIVVDFTTSTTCATLVAILDSTGLSALTTALSYCGLLSAADSILSKDDSTTVSDTYPDIYPVIGKAVDIELAVTVGGVTAIGTTVSGATDIDTTVGDVAVVVTAVGGVTDIDTTVGKVPVDDTTFVGDCDCELGLSRRMAWHLK